MQHAPQSPQVNDTHRAESEPGGRSLSSSGRPPVTRSVRRPGSRPQVRRAGDHFRGKGIAGSRPSGRSLSWWLSGKGVPSGAVNAILGMPQNFIACDREQALLMPPSLRDWVPGIIWCGRCLASVEEMDLSAFYAAYRPDGHGRPAYEPSMMVALLLYAYAQGNRSSRGIERKCREDVAYRVIAREPGAGSLDDRGVPPPPRDGAGRACSARCWGCVEKAGLVKVGVVAIDGTKVSANASMDATGL